MVNSSKASDIKYTIMCHGVMSDQLCRYNLIIDEVIIGRENKKVSKVSLKYFSPDFTDSLIPRDFSAYKKKYKIPNTAKVCEISDYADQLIAQRRNQRRKSNTKSIFRPTVRHAILNFHHVITE